MTTKIKISNESDPDSTSHVIEIMTQNLEKRVIYPGSSAEFNIWKGVSLTITELNPTTNELEFGITNPNDNDSR